MRIKAMLNKSFSLPANPHGAVGISENWVLIQRSLNVRSTMPAGLSIA